MQINPDAYIKPYCNGVKLIQGECPTPGTAITSVFEILSASPFNAYFLDTESCMLDLNELTAQTMGFDSPHATVGKSVFDITKDECAAKIRKNDLDIITNRRAKIIEEDLFRVDGAIIQTLSIKSPLYNEANAVIGILGSSIVLGEHPLASSLTMLSQMGLLNRGLPEVNLTDAYLSRREKECVNLLVVGKTAREISNHLALSKRTVEHYIDNIKTKLAVSTKSELIQKCTVGYISN